MITQIITGINNTRAPLKQTVFLNEEEVLLKGVVLCLLLLPLEAEEMKIRDAIVILVSMDPRTSMVSNTLPAIKNRAAQQMTMTCTDLISKEARRVKKTILVVAGIIAVDCLVLGHHQLPFMTSMKKVISTSMKVVVCATVTET